MDNVKGRKIIRLLYSIIFNLIILLVALYFFKPFFEEIDDTHIAMIAEGAYGELEPHLIYVNIILGKFYTILYSVAGTVRWHSVLQYVMIYFGYVCFLYIMSKNRRGTSVATGVVVATFYEMYVSLQYTKTAAFLSAIACLMIFQAVRKHKVGKIDRFFGENDVNESATSDSRKEKTYILLGETKYFFVAMFFVVYAGMLRFEAFFIGLVPMLGVLIIEFLRSREKKAYSCFFLIAMTVVILLSFVDKYCYSADTEWSEFTKYNKARTMLTDYRYDVLYYERYGNKLQTMGVSENDAFMILTYQFADSDVYSTEYFENIMSQFEAKKINKSFFVNFYNAIGDEISRLSPLVPVAALLLLFVICIIVNKQKWEGIELHTDSKYMIAGMIVMVLSVSAAIFYFAYSGRISHRLIASILVAAILGMTFVIDSNDYIKNEQVAFSNKVMHITGSFIMALAVITIGFNALNYFTSQSDYHTNKKKCEREINEFHRMSQDKEHLYVVDTFTFQNSFKYEVFNPTTEGEYSNIVYSGSWFTNSPVANNVCKRFRYNNPYDAIIRSRGDVLLEDRDYVEYKQKYIKEHYNKQVKFETEDSINSVKKLKPYRLN